MIPATIAVGQRIGDDYGQRGLVVDHLNGLWHVLWFYGNNGEAPIVQVLDPEAIYNIIE